MMEIEAAVADGSGDREQRAKFLNLPEGVYNSVRHALINGTFRPGEKLSIRGLAATLGLSATPVRDALQRLAGEGVLVAQPYRSIRVPQLSYDEVAELWMIRGLLEREAARAAVERADDGLIPTLSAIELRLERARRRPDPAAVTMLNAEFHFALYAASALPRLCGEIERQWLSAAPVIRAFMDSTIVPKSGDRLHAAILHGLRRRDREMVADSVAEDIATAAQRILAAMKAAE